MVRRVLLTVLGGLLWALSWVAHADPPECLDCHGADELKGLDVKAVKDALADPGIPPHKKFAELTEDQIAEILASLE